MKLIDFLYLSLSIIVYAYINSHFIETINLENDSNISQLLSSFYPSFKIQCRLSPVINAIFNFVVEHCTNKITTKIFNYKYMGHWSSADLKRPLSFGNVMRAHHNPEASFNNFFSAIRGLFGFSFYSLLALIGPLKIFLQSNPTNFGSKLFEPNTIKGGFLSNYICIIIIGGKCMITWENKANASHLTEQKKRKVQKLY